MRSIRLLPIVIFAAVALLTFKGIGLFTNGGYVLVGNSPAEAAGGGDNASGDGSGTDDAAALPVAEEPTMADTNPTVDDTSPTLPLKVEADAHEAADGEGEFAAGSDETGHEPTEPRTKESEAACLEAENTVAVANARAADTAATADAAPCEPEATVNAAVDALPHVMDSTGNLVPLEERGVESQNAVLERLSERRSELDAREEELGMRMALVEAAEKRISERTAALEALGARINAQVEENNSAENGQFKSIVEMYQTMKPKEAAAILNELDMATLVRVARAISPRKMAPIMARMDPIKAKDLTANMAVAVVEPTMSITGEDMAALPQIVGQ